METAGIADALRDGWAPLRWCLFVYADARLRGPPGRLEAVLANEDVLPPGEYPATFRIFGPRGLAWEKRATAVSPPSGRSRPRCCRRRYACKARRAYTPSPHPWKAPRRAATGRRCASHAWMNCRNSRPR